MPIRPVPDFVLRWKFRARVLRVLDFIAAWFALWMVGIRVVAVSPGDVAVVALAVLCGCAFIAPFRTRWRPLSAVVGIVISRRVRPGNRAWYITRSQAEQVLITA